MIQDYRPFWIGSRLLSDALARLHPLIGLARVFYLVSPEWAWWTGRVFLRDLRDA